MDASTVMTSIKGTEYAIKGWSWLRRLWSGTVTITRPENRKAYSTEWVRIEGEHFRVASGPFHYWLMTTTGAEWWPAEEIKLNVNGKWDSRVNIGKMSGPRSSIAVVVRVSPTIHALLNELRRLRHKATDYVGLKISQSKREGWDVVTHVDIQIPEGEIKAGQTS